MNVRVHPLAPVIGLDVDGTIAGYHTHFKWFAELYLQRDLPWKWSLDHEVSFADALELDLRTYRDIKLAYRQGGMKRSIPILGDVRDLRAQIQSWRADIGVQVWITTTRPWNRLDNIDPDTQFWLNRNVGRVDGVIYGDEKYYDLVDIVGKERVLGIFDDLPENVAAAEELGLNAVLRNGPHNAWCRSEPGQLAGLKTASSTREMGWNVFDWSKDYKKENAS